METRAIENLDVDATLVDPFCDVDAFIRLRAARSQSASTRTLLVGSASMAFSGSGRLRVSLPETFPRKILLAKRFLTLRMAFQSMLSEFLQGRVPKRVL